MRDVIIVGAGSAGLSAALLLGRSRRQVVLLDHGAPRNAPSGGVHNFLSRDGTPPAELRHISFAQLRQYESVEVRAAAASNAQAVDGGFQVLLDDGSSVQGRFLILATGVYDELPPIDGFAERWGSSIFHCPYCHGWEVRDEPLAIRGNGDTAIEMAMMLSGWSSDLVLCTDGPATLSAEQHALLARHGIPVRQEPIAALEGEGTALRHIHFASGEPLARRGLFVRLPQRQRSELPAQLGCALVAQPPLPHLVKVDATGATSVPGVYAVGDMATPMQQALAAAASASLSAAMINSIMLREAFV